MSYKHFSSILDQNALPIQHDRIVVVDEQALSY
jgi:hypothetical protein